MKCQKCDRQATFHITELAGGKPHEVHVCEEHAREYLAETEPEPNQIGSLAGALAQQFPVGKAAEELARLDQQACPVCGITFFEFRNQGRLGCPHDYLHFQKELDPLIMNIHGETEHRGKRPGHIQGNTDRRTDLIRLRRELKEAISAEEYERASQLRDEIRNIEGSK
jgi:protein arginine kinase activator